MDIQEYIASGIIETYVLGAATPAEEKELLQLADKHPEIRRELELARQSLESYAMLHSKRPPAFVKENLMQAIGAQHTPSSGNFTTASDNSNSPALRVAYLRPIAIAAGILLVASIGINAYLYGKLNRAEKELTALQNQSQQLAQENKIQKAIFEDMSHDMEVIKDPNTRPVVMKGTSPSGDMMATVYWNTSTKETYVALKNMPSLPAGKQFQLWAIVDGKPVDMGVFDMVTDSLIRCKPTSQAQAFAVTIEQQGGSPVPTLEALVVKGDI